jgi:glutamate synthase domain-containing protein 3
MIQTKTEIIGDTGPSFLHGVNDLKVIVKGSVGNDSACNVKNSKFTIFGSCGNNFGNNAVNSEFYIFGDCRENAFSKAKKSKIVIGGQIQGDFLFNDDVIAVILNLKGESYNLIPGTKPGIIYLRGEKEKFKNVSLKPVAESDEDVYLPLISEFARQFNYSLSEIKSLPFYRME